MIMVLKNIRNRVVYVIFSVSFRNIDQRLLNSEANLRCLVLQMTEELSASLLISSCANETPVFQRSSLDHVPVLNCPIPVAFFASLQRFENTCAATFHNKFFWRQLASSHLEKLLFVFRILVRVSNHHSPPVHVSSWFSSVHATFIRFKKAAINIFSQSC